MVNYIARAAALAALIVGIVCWRVIARPAAMSMCRYDPIEDEIW